MPKEFAEGAVITLPTKELEKDGYVFKGWYTDIECKNKFVIGTKMGVTDVILYAGWEKFSPSTYTKITEELLDWSGKYLIVYEKNNDAYIFNGVDSANAHVKGKIENNQIVSTIEIEKNICTISKYNNGYSIEINNQFIAGTSGSNSLKLNTEEQVNNISYNNESIKIESNTSILRFNDASNAMQFRYYRSSTYTAQKPIQLYKLEEKQEEKPNVDETILTSYTSTLSIDNSKAIRFIGSVKETEFDKISNIGFNFTLTLDNDKGNPISKEYSSDVTKLYKTINDSNTGTFDKTEAVYEKDGFLNFSLILKNLPKDLLASIYYYSYAVIDGKTYNSPTTEVVIAGDLIEFR